MHHDASELTEKDCEELLEGLEYVVPLFLFIMGLFGYIVLRVKQATQPETNLGVAAEHYLAFALVLILGVPYLIQRIVGRRDTRGSRSRVMGAIVAFGTLSMLWVIGTTLYAGTGMLYVATGYLYDEAVWFVPLALLSTLLGSVDATKIVRIGRGRNG